MDLLILDEIGKQHGSDSERVGLFAILDSRSRDCRPTIVLSNETLAGVESTLGAAAFDRLCHHGTLLNANGPVTGGWEGSPDERCDFKHL